tara:strand:+ start:24 stop:1268 length:1245 start_codon:yes stop_codon:yes gene_type:complete
MKKILLIITILFFVNDLLSQDKIKADIAIMNFLGRVPQKVERNTLPDNLIKILYFNKQPDSFPKIGYLNKKGEIKTQPKYNMGLDFYGNYANIIKDSIYGYIDKEGNETLFEQYEETFFYYGNTGIAKKNNKYGLINRKGDTLTDFRYAMINLFGSKHFNMYTKDKKDVIFNESGKIIFKNNLNFNIKSHYFESDSLLVYEEIIEGKKLNGLINLNEKVILKPQYENIYYIGDKDFFIVKKDNKWGFIDKTGTEKIPLNYNEVGFNINEDLIPAKKNDKWGFINRENEIIIPFMYDEAYAFMDGLAFVKKGDKYGCINLKNKLVIKFNLEKTEFPFFTNDMALFKKGDKYGFINKKGKIKIPAIYDKAFPFVSELAYVELNVKSGFINKSGKEIIPLSNKQLWLESDGFIRFAE